MRKERWIVPVVVVLALAWAVAQYLASLLFERELERALADLEARGDLRISRDDVRIRATLFRAGSNTETFEVASRCFEAFEISCSWPS